ncbi:MAG TPA: hypothetical protein VGJ93_02055 [Desulfuromonadaceae bacterium]|jgi:putative membrane protein
MKNNKARHFFNKQEKNRIRLLVKEAERLTSGEIATMVVDESDSYREAEILGAVLLSSLLALIIAIAIHHITIWTYIPLVCLIYFPLFWIFRRFPGLKLSFVSRRRIEEAVRERAVSAFFSKGLYRTREETGILIFISLLEHKVWILGDRGINALIEPESWRSFADELAKGIRDGHACEALGSVVQKCGTILAEHFPRRSDDTNELPDELIV